MRWIQKLRLRLRSLFRSGRVEQELDEELQYHLDHLVEDYVARGMSREDAWYAARREMGAIEPRKEECRDARGLALVDSVRQDVTYALRTLRRSPALCRRRDPFPRSRHRRQHRDLHAVERPPALFAAGRGKARAARHAHQSG